MKKFLCTIIFLSVCIFSFISVDAATLYPNSTVNVKIDNNFIFNDIHVYTFTVPETQYYIFTLDNKNVETNNNITQIGNAFVNFFLRLKMDFYNSNGDKVGEAFAKSGYSTSLACKLNKGEIYTIKIYVESFLGISQNWAEGNYSLSVKQLTDIGADSWNSAQKVEHSVHFTAGIEIDGDEDWFKFTVPDSPHYLNVTLENIQGYTQTFELYEYVPGAGSTPLRNSGSFSVGSNNKSSKIFTLNRKSTYYYVITSGGEGGYVLDVKLVDDAGGASIDDAKKVNLNTSYECSFEKSDDSDYIKFTTGDSLAYYRIKLTFPKAYDYIGIYLYDEDKKETKKASSSYYDYSSYYVDWQLEPNKTYYVRFYLAYMTDYEFSITESVDDFPNSFEGTPEVVVNRTYESKFDAPDDNEYMQFTTSDNLAYYRIKLTFPKAYDYIGIYLYDEDKNEIKKAYSSYSDYSSYYIDCQLEPNKTYYVRFYLAYETDYEFSITESVDDFPDSFEGATEVVVNKTYESKFDAPDDNEYMQFTTGDNLAYYRIKLTFPKAYDYIGIYLYDEDKNEIKKAYSSYHDYSSYYIDCQLEPNKTYYVRFYLAYMADYEFSITESIDEFPDSFEGAPKVAVNKTYESKFDAPGDSDYMQFATGNNLAYYRIKLEFPTAHDYIGIYLYNEDKEEINGAYSSYSDYSSYYIDCQLEPNKTYYVRFYLGHISNYEFSITEMIDEDANSSDKANWISYNKEYKKDLAISSDIDWFKIKVNEGTNLYVKLLNESCSKAYCDIYSERDVHVISIGGSSSKSAYTKSAVLEGGTYYIKVSGSAGYYTLTLSQCGSGHSEHTLYGKAATCTEAGLSDGKQCYNCGTVTVKQQEIKALGHSYKNDICTRCGINKKCANGHTSESIPKKEATCTEAGCEASVVCSVCKYVIKQGDVIPQLKHTFKNDICEYCEKIDPRLNPRSFNDVKENAWYKNAVDFATVKGLFNGTTETKFEPDTAMTRAMLVTVLWRYAGCPKADTNASFSDVLPDQWYTKAVAWAAENSIVNGVDIGKFAPDGKVTREQLAVILYRYAEKIGANVNARKSLAEYPDSKNISSWAKDSLEWAVANNFINGTSKSGYKTAVIDNAGNATRAQVATIFMRFMQWFNK